VTIDGEVLNTMHKFKYLGSYVSDDNKVDTEISHRIQMASAAYGKLKKRLWDSHDISLTTKLAVFRAVILPTLLYSMETMTLYRRHFNKLTNFQLRHLRQMLKGLVSGSCIAGFCYCLHFTQIQQIAIQIPCLVHF
jgi:hypothetical protein